jgi:purine-nucleoside phosphorylase
VTFGAEQARRAAGVLRRMIPADRPVAGLVLGSGLGALAHQIRDAVSVPFAQIPGFPAATVEGHAGNLIAGQLAGRPVIALSGRYHLYEGHDARLVAYPIRVLHALGVHTLVLSNASGGLNPAFTAGELMLIRDHINLTFRNPLIGPVQPGDLRFPDMSEPYDEGLASHARHVAADLHLALREGVYVGLLGPVYETPAEVRMLQRLGADAVGMSTVTEVIVARALGMRVLGVSCVTNLAGALSPGPITHDDVLKTTTQAAEKFQALIRGVIGRLEVATSHGA